jgi:hypothetical protein
MLTVMYKLPHVSPISQKAITEESKRRERRNAKGELRERVRGG